MCKITVRYIVTIYPSYIVIYYDITRKSYSRKNFQKCEEIRNDKRDSSKTRTSSLKTDYLYYCYFSV